MFPKLGRFIGNGERLEGHPGIFLEVGRQLIADLFGVHITDHNKAKVIRDVAALVILEHIFPGQLVVNVEVADDRLLEGAAVVGCAEKEKRCGAVGIVISHGKLTSDHFLFPVILLFGECGIHHHVSEDIDGLGGTLGRHVDPVDGAVVGGIGVDVPPLVLNLTGNDSGCSGRGSLEKHVLEDVGETCTQEFPLMDGSRVAPGLDTGDGRTVIFLHN